MPPRRGPRLRRPVVTLTTDIGWAYAAQMKAVLLAELGAGQVIDLAHDLPAHGVREAAFLLRAMAERFPPGTVHVCIVDPGVGGRRAALAVRCRDGSTLIGPDNGVLAPLAERLGVERVVAIDRGRVAAGERVGRTFDGRDLFAPAASLIALGKPLSKLGPASPLHPLKLPSARRAPTQISGEVLHVDRFGNLVTNVPSAFLPKRAARFALRVGRQARAGVPFARTYEELGRGRLGLLPSSFGLLEVAVGQGSAARRLSGHPRSSVTIRWSAGRTSSTRGARAAHNRK